MEYGAYIGPDIHKDTIGIGAGVPGNSAVANTTSARGSHQNGSARCVDVGSAAEIRRLDAGVGSGCRAGSDARLDPDAWRLQGSGIKGAPTARRIRAGPRTFLAGQ